VLEQAGLIRTDRRGRYKFHEIDTRPLERIVDRWLRNDTKEDECASS
jgi:DNA-binding transcriptional ArsR family regulator